MTDTITYRPLLLQHGYSDGASYVSFAANLGDFAESVYAFTIPAGGTYTQLYDFGVTRDSERNIQLDTPNYFTQASQSQYFTLSLGSNIASPRSDIGIQFQTGTSAAAWEATDIAENATDWQDYENPIAVDSSVWVLSGSVYDMIFELDFNTQFGSGATNASIKRTIQQPTWNGLLSLAFPNSGASYQVKLSTVGGYNRGFLEGQYVPFHTGWDGRGPERGRPVRDMRTGLPAFAEDLVEDGYVSGIWTSPESWDPVDPRDVRPVEFPPDEGVKKDDVPV